NTTRGTRRATTGRPQSPGEGWAPDTAREPGSAPHRFPRRCPDEVLPPPRGCGAYGGSRRAERRDPVRRALHVHALSTYLVFQALTPVLALGYAAVLSQDGTGWSTWLFSWAVLTGVGLVWTQLVWGPCWEAGADHGLPVGVRIALMTISGAALMLPFLVLNVVVDPVWFLYVLFLTPYGLVS